MKTKTAPTESEIRQEILAAALKKADPGDGYTLKELVAMTGLSPNKAREAMRAMITVGRASPATVYRQDLGGRRAAVVGYRFV